MMMCEFYLISCSTLQSVWSKGKESIHKERMELETYMSAHPDESDVTGVIEPWDWRFYAERVRQSQYNIDGNEVIHDIYDCYASTETRCYICQIKPYFS